MQLRSNPANAPVLDQAMSAIDTLEAGKRYDVTGMNPALLPLFAPQVQGFLINVFSYDPAKLISAVSKPVLILQGERDIQVSVADAERLKQAAPQAKLVLLPDTNHVLKTVTTNDPARKQRYVYGSQPAAGAGRRGCRRQLRRAGGKKSLALSSSSPVQTGEGDHPQLAKQAEDGGGGVGRNETLATKMERRVRRPLHHPSRCALRMVPPPRFAGADKRGRSRDACVASFLPRANGGGGPHRRRGGGGAGGNETLSTKGSGESDAPSTILRATRYGWSPSPASRGRKSVAVLATHARHSFLPRETGEGDRPAQQDGGGGAGLDEILSTNVDRQVGRPLHHPSRCALRMVPLPASRGRKSAIVLAGTGPASPSRAPSWRRPLSSEFAGFLVP